MKKWTKQLLEESGYEIENAQIESVRLTGRHPRMDEEGVCVSWDVSMDNELYCPMKMASNPLGRCVCEKEKCAWWRQLDSCCSVWQIAWKLDDIEKKMKR